VSFVGRKVDSTAKHVQKTAINGFTDLRTAARIQFFGALSTKLRCGPEAEIPEIARDTRPHARDLFELFQDFVLAAMLHTRHLSLFLFLQFLVSETSGDVIVDHPRGLHECVTNGRADKIESSLSQILAHRCGLLR